MPFIEEFLRIGGKFKLDGALRVQFYESAENLLRLLFGNCGGRPVYVHPARWRIGPYQKLKTLD